MNKLNDLINRKSAIETIDSVWTRWDVDTIDRFRDALHEEFIKLPPQTRPKMKWQIRKWGADAKCPNCKFSFRDVYDFDNFDRFCRKCGQEMDGLENVE